MESDALKVSALGIGKNPTPVRLIPQSDVATADFEALPGPSTRTIRSRIVRVSL
jgi:hypothetical protein